MAAMMNGGMGNGMWNNPFVYLVWMMFAGRMWGNDGFGNGNGVQNAEVQNQLSAIREQMSNNQNSNLIMDAIKGTSCDIKQLASNLNCDFNALQGAICDVRAGIDKVAGQVGFSAERVINAVNMGDCNVIQAMKDCCCQTQQNLLRMQGDLALQNCQQTNTLTNSINTVNVGMERGFASTAYANQQQTCDLITNQNSNTQRIIDVLNNHWDNQKSLQIQDLKFENSQLKQNAYFAHLVNGANCGCGCNSGCGCNNNF